MIKITINKDLILKHANSAEPIYIAGTFNNWNCTVDQFEYDAASNSYTKVLDIPADSIISFKFVSSGVWFGLPEDVLAIDQTNSDGNNIINVSSLPYQNDMVKVELLKKDAENNFIVLQEEKADIDNSRHPTGLTNQMRSENFSNILISTDDNDKNSISSSLKSTKMNFEGEKPPSAELTETPAKTEKKERKPSLLKRIFGYK